MAVFDFEVCHLALLLLKILFGLKYPLNKEEGYECYCKIEEQILKLNLSDDFHTGGRNLVNLLRDIALTVGNAYEEILNDEIFTLHRFLGNRIGAGSGDGHLAGLSFKFYLLAVTGHLEFCSSRGERNGIANLKGMCIKGGGDIVIEKVANRDKTITLLQELTGKGILTLEQSLDSSIESGIPVMKNLTPGYKDFVEQALRLRGVSKVSTNR